MNKKIHYLLISFLIISCGGPDNGAELTDGIASADHRIFVTSSTVDGAMTSGSGSTGLAKADSICATAATNASLKRTYKAIISDSSTHAKDRLVISGAVYVVAGSATTKIAADSASLWNADTTSLLAAIDRDEDGTYTTSVEVWTGSLADGTRELDNCTNWTTASSGTSGDIGNNGNVDAKWLEMASASTCNNSKHLYCISQ
jgi:hypothetical protein